MSYQKFSPGGFGVLPPVTKYILGINIILFVAKYLLKVNIDHYLLLHYFKSEYFKPFQFVTSLFVHFGIPHILFNMLGVYTFGSILERLWGSKRFLNFYLICGLAAAAAQMASYYYTDYKLMESGESNENLTNWYNEIGCAGASGSLMGLLGAFAFLFPNTPLAIFMFPPMKAKYLVALYAIVSLVFGVGNAVGSLPGGGIAHFAHLGGLVVGLIIVYIWRRNSKTFF